MKENNKTEKIVFGGGCHWCTEAVFQSLKGVENVEQGFVASKGENSSFSEAVIVHYNPFDIALDTLIEIHLYTHKSNSDHSMRNKYRSAVYTFSQKQSEEANEIISALQPEFDNKLITKVYPFHSFKPSEKQFHNYYFANPEKPFCENHIRPKLRRLLAQFSKSVDHEKLEKSDCKMM